VVSWSTSTGRPFEPYRPGSGEPDTDHPETRADFRHPDILAHCAAHRRETLSILMGMVCRWRDAGRRPGSTRLGGFEGWASIIGGILEHHGQARPWLSNRLEWTSQADEESHDLEALVEAWSEKYGPTMITATEILGIVRETQIYAWVTSAPEAGQLVRLSRNVLRTIINRPVAGRKIRRRQCGHAKAWYYFIERIGDQGELRGFEENTRTVDF